MKQRRPKPPSLSPARVRPQCIGARARRAGPSRRADPAPPGARSPSSLRSGCPLLIYEATLFRHRIRGSVGGTGVSWTVTAEAGRPTTLLAASWRTFRTHRRRRPRRQWMRHGERETQERPSAARSPPCEPVCGGDGPSFVGRKAADLAMYVDDGRLEHLLLRVVRGYGLTGAPTVDGTISFRRIDRLRIP